MHNHIDTNAKTVQIDDLYLHNTAVVEHSASSSPVFHQTRYRAGIGAFRLGRGERWAVNGGHHCTT